VGRGVAVEPSEGPRDPVLGVLAHHEGDRVHADHDGDEDGDAQVPVGEQGIQAAGDVGVLAVGALDHLLHEAVDEAVAALGQQGGAVGSQVRLEEREAGLDLRADGLAGVAALHQLLGVGHAFQQLQREAAGRLGLGQLLVPQDLLADLLELPLHVRAVVHGGQLAEGRAGHLQDGVLEALDALLAVAHGGHHRASQEPLQGGQVDPQALLLGVVHHVQDEDHGPVQLQELGGEVEVALQVGGVQHVDDDVDAGVGHEQGGDALVLAAGGKRIGAGQVHDLHGTLGRLEGAAAAFDRDPRPVAYMVPGAGEGVEDGRFSTVGVARKRQGRHLRSPRTRGCTDPPPASETGGNP